MDFGQNTQQICIPKQHLPAKLVRILVAAEASVSKDTAIAIYEYTETVLNRDDEGVATTMKRLSRIELISPFTGILSKYHYFLNEIISQHASPVAMVVEQCSHSVQVHSLCALCGKDLSIPDYSGSDTTRATINMSHDALGVTVSHLEAKRIENEHAERLIKEQKLSLILDLDQTIIHATVDPTVGEWMRDQNNPNYPALKDVHPFQLPGSPIFYYIKLRPGTRQFLENVSKLYEMHIYTMGTRLYAEAVARVIDPGNSLFKERILSRDESGSFAVKSIQRLFPCNQNMVVVVDDRGDIWKWPANLIKVRPYDFFVGIGDINEPIYAASQILSDVKQTKTIESSKVLAPEDQSAIINAEIQAEQEGSDAPVMHQLEKVHSHEVDKQINDRPMLAESIRRESLGNVESCIAPAFFRKRPVLNDDDNELDIVTKVLQNVHRQFYNNPTPGDSRKIMSKMRHNILDGCVLVFSSVIPLGIDPASHEVWVIALSAGAECRSILDESTTHVVAGKRGTAKINQAKQMLGVSSVGIEWLYDSIWKWKRMPEIGYLLEPHAIDTSIIDLEDAQIVSGSWEHKDDVYVKFGHEDWENMNKEIEEAMGDDSSEDEWDDALDTALADEELENDRHSSSSSSSEGLPDTKKQRI